MACSSLVHSRDTLCPWCQVWFDCFLTWPAPATAPRWRMPRWKSARENFSFGLCVLSSFWPQPSSSVSAPRTRGECGDDRDRAPFADEDRPRAEARLDRRAAALQDRGSRAAPRRPARRGDRPAPSRMPGGSSSSSSLLQRRRRSSCGSWFGTRRKLNFALALAGSTVLAPSP